MLQHVRDFDKLEFLYDDPRREYYKLHPCNRMFYIEIEIKKPHENNDWVYTNRPQNHCLKLDVQLINTLRRELINCIKINKFYYYRKAFKNLNLVRHWLHPDIVPRIVMTINELRYSHYLETV